MIEQPIIATTTMDLTFPNISSNTVDNATGKNKESRLHFPCKVYEMLEAAEQEGLEDIVSWNKEGTGFTVHNKDLFTKTIIPMYFNQTKYKSFQRQLSLYGFQRITVGENKGLRYHEKLRRGIRELCKEMKPIGYKPRCSSENRPKMGNKQPIAKENTLQVKPTVIAMPPPPRVVIDKIPAVVSSSSIQDDDQPKAVPYHSYHCPVAFTADGFPEMGCFEGKTFYLMDGLNISTTDPVPSKTVVRQQIPDDTPSISLDGQMKRAWEIGFAVALTMKPKTSVEVPACIDALDMHIMSA
jgi:hypothetical protein